VIGGNGRNQDRRTHFENRQQKKSAKSRSYRLMTMHTVPDVFVFTSAWCLALGSFIAPFNRIIDVGWNRRRNGRHLDGDRRGRIYGLEMIGILGMLGHGGCFVV
jgi:hypothetical protein